MVTLIKKLHLPRCGWTAASSAKQHKPSLSRRALTTRSPSIEVLAGISLTSAGKPYPLNVGGASMLQPQQLPSFLPTSPLAAHARRRKLCRNLSNFSYKSEAESQQQHFALYMDRHLRSVTIMIKVSSRHMQCTHFKPSNSRMPAVALPQDILSW